MPVKDYVFEFSGNVGGGPLVGGGAIELGVITYAWVTKIVQTGGSGFLCQPTVAVPPEQKTQFIVTVHTCGGHGASFSGQVHVQVQYRTWDTREEQEHIDVQEIQCTLASPGDEGEPLVHVFDNFEGPVAFCVVKSVEGPQHAYFVALRTDESTVRVEGGFYRPDGQQGPLEAVVTVLVGIRF